MLACRRLPPPGPVMEEMRVRTTPRLPVAAGIALLALASGASPAAAEEPAAEARAVMQALFERLYAVKSDATASPAEKRALVERALEERLDHGALSAAALGPLASKFDHEQSAQFAFEYSRYLTYLFVRNVARFMEKPGDITSVRVVEGTDRVQLRAVGRARRPFMPGAIAEPRGAPKPEPWDFTLHKRFGEWRITAITIAGVSVSANFRAQFDAFLKRNEPAALIAELARRNRENDEKNPFEA